MSRNVPTDETVAGVGLTCERVWRAGVGGGGELSGTVARGVATESMHAMRDAPIETLMRPGTPNISAGALQEGYEQAIRTPSVRDAVWPRSRQAPTKQPYGSTTATVVVLSAQGRLLSAEIGNSQFALVRRAGGVFGTVYMSSDHRYVDNPLVNTQIGLQDPVHFFSRPPLRSTNCVDIMVQQDDLVVAATDGVWDLYQGTPAERTSAFTADVNSAYVSFATEGRARCFLDHLGCFLVRKFASKRLDDGTLFISNIVFAPHAAETPGDSWPLFKSFDDEARSVPEGICHSVEHTGPHSGVVACVPISRYPQDPRSGGKHAAAVQEGRPLRHSSMPSGHRNDAAFSQPVLTPHSQPQKNVRSAPWEGGVRAHGAVKRESPGVSPDTALSAQGYKPPPRDQRPFRDERDFGDQRPFRDQRDFCGSPYTHPEDTLRDSRIGRKRALEMPHQDSPKHGRCEEGHRHGKPRAARAACVFFAQKRCRFGKDCHNAH